MPAESGVGSDMATMHGRELQTVLPVQMLAQSRIAKNFTAFAQSGKAQGMGDVFTIQLRIATDCCQSDAQAQLMPGNRGQVGHPLLHVDGRMASRFRMAETGQQFVAHDLLDSPLLPFDGARDALQATIDGTLGLLLVETLMQGCAAGHIGNHENAAGVSFGHA